MDRRQRRPTQPRVSRFRLLAVSLFCSVVSSIFTSVWTLWRAPEGGGAAPTPTTPVMCHGSQTGWEPAIAAALEPWRSGGVTRAMIDAAAHAVDRSEGGYVVAVHAGRLLVREIAGSRGAQQRAPLLLFHKVLACFDVPDLLLVLHDGDDALSVRQLPPLPVFGWNKHPARHWDVPWPCHEQFNYPAQWLLPRAALPRWGARDGRAVFRGAPTGGEYTAAAWRERARSKVVLFCAARTDLCDARFTSLAPVADADAARAMRAALQLAPPMTMREQMAFKLSILPDGNGAPASRSGGFFASGFAVLKHESGFVEFFYPLLRPWAHYVPLLANLSDLGEKIEWARRHDAAAERIANASRAFAERHLTDAAVVCYAAQMLARYASLQRFDVAAAVESDAGLRPTGENRWFRQLRREEEKRLEKRTLPYKLKAAWRRAKRALGLAPAQPRRRRRLSDASASAELSSPGRGHAQISQKREQLGAYLSQCRAR